MDVSGGGFGGGGGHHHGGGGFDSGPARGGYSDSGDNRGGRHGGQHQSGGGFGAGAGFNGRHEAGGNFSGDYFTRDGNNWRGSHFGWGPVIAGGAAGAAVAGAAAMASREGRTTYYTAPPGYVSQLPAQPYPELTHQRPRSSTWLKLLPIINVGVIVVVLYLLLFSFGSERMEVGVKEQHLLEANSFFVKSIKVAPISSVRRDVPLSVLGFKSTPPLSDTIHWQEHFYHVPVRYYGYERWKFWLNRGSTVTIHYNIQYNTQLMLAVLKGQSRMSQWIYSPTTFSDYEEKRTLSGEGTVTFRVRSDGEFYVALGNFNAYTATVNVLDFMVESTVYDLSHADTHCDIPSAKICSLQLPWGSERAGVLLTPMNGESDEVVTLLVSYSTRWTSYFWIIAFTWLTTYLIGKTVKRQEARRARQLPLVDPLYRQMPAPVQPPTTSQPSEAAFLLAGQSQPLQSQQQQDSLPRRTPLVRRLAAMLGFRSRREAQVMPETGRTVPANEGVPGASAPIPSSWVAVPAGGRPQESKGPSMATSSAYVTGGTQPQDGRVVAPSAPPLDMSEEGQGGEAGQGGSEGAALGVNDTCAICLDAKKDAILIDCGHRATCYNCSKLLLEARPPLCPICRKVIKQVIKVYDA